MLPEDHKKEMEIKKRKREPNGSLFYNLASFTFRIPNETKAISSDITKTPTIINENDIENRKYEAIVNTVSVIPQFTRDGLYQ